MRTWIALMAITVVATGCASTSELPTASTRAASSARATTVQPVQPVAVRSSDPMTGWADEVVRAGHTAYVVGWNPDDSAAFWHVDHRGNLSPRTPPPGSPGDPNLASTGRIVDLAFGGTSDGLAITGTPGSGHHQGHAELFATDDGARTWTPVVLPTIEQPLQVVMAGGAAYVLTSNCLATNGPCNHATVWSLDPTDDSAVHTFDTLPAKTHTAGPISIAAYGADVWVLLDMGAGLETARHSEDGGQTWQPFKADGCLAEPMVATSGRVLWARCFTGMMQHFSRQSGPAAPVTVFSPDLGGTTNSDLIPLSDTTAYAIIADASPAQVAVTRDGGRTTHVLAAIPRSIARQVFQVTFVSRRVGYLVTSSDGLVYATRDSGRSWHRVGRGPG